LNGAGAGSSGRVPLLKCLPTSGKLRLTAAELFPTLHSDIDVEKGRPETASANGPKISSGGVFLPKTGA